MKCPHCDADNLEDSRFCRSCGETLKDAKDIDSFLTKTIRTPATGYDKGSIFAGRYHIIEKLGEGGMGVVYKAKDVRLKRTVALKFLPPELTKEAESRERFVREAQSAAALSHPNICTIHEIDEEEGKSFIVMEYVEGQSLKEKLKSGPVEHKDALNIAIQATEGLESAHKKGIIHRDIKSGNIMITHEGQAKILDFGLAKVAGESLITKEAKTMGTAAYMSPEQARGEPVDHRTDIWSLGVVLYELLSGQLPFKGERETSMMYSIVHEEPKSLKALRPDVPDEIVKIIDRSLEKKPEARYSSAAEIRKDLSDYKSVLLGFGVKKFGLKNILRTLRKPQVAIPIVILIGIFSFFVVRIIKHRSEINWARTQALPEILKLSDGDKFHAAFLIARQVEKIIPEDPLFVQALPEFSAIVDIETEPQGTAYYIKELDANTDDWLFLGTTPIKEIRVPKMPLYIRAEKEGFITQEYLGVLAPNQNIRNLEPIDTIPQEMVKVSYSGAETNIWYSFFGYETERSVKVDDFLIDRNEVTNREFKEFIDSGGYEKQEYWKHNFIRNGREFSWEDSMAEFRDQTGQAGPSGWSFGTYPEGKDDYPVTGISWYEAAAYAEFTGKRLPTIYHFELAARSWWGGVLIPRSNFSHENLAPVGSYKGSLNGWGIFDIAGNAREWCSNATGENRFILGGSWNDPPYFFGESDIRHSFDRDHANGFRCIKLISPESTSDKLEMPIKQAAYPDYANIKPFSDDVFNTWTSFTSYAKSPLNSEVELVDDGSRYWRMEKISFDAAYEKERMSAYLFLPKNSKPPYQTAIYWPGGSAEEIPSSGNGENLEIFHVSYLVKGGRAVLFPILKGTYERYIPNEIWEEWGEAEYKDLVIKQMKDYGRSIDYLETRDDIDSDSLFHIGWSWGAYMGIFPCTAEKRLKTGILLAGGLIWFYKEVIGWASRVRIPMLMINGRYDSGFLLEETVKPLFEVLGTSKEHKKLVVLESQHALYSRRDELIKETFEWLDKYLGPVKKR